MKLSRHDEVLKKHLNEHRRITVDQFSRVAFISHREAEETLVNFSVLGIVKLVSNEEEEYFEMGSNH
jgi:hypothetical protein